MTSPELDVVEFMLAARAYTDNEEFDPGDLPPAYRGAFWDPDAGEEGDPGGIERPLSVTDATITEATGVVSGSILRGRGLGR